MKILKKNTGWKGVGMCERERERERERGSSVVVACG